MSEILFKDSGIEWIGKIPKHWEIKKIKFVAKLNPNFKNRKEVDDRLEVSFLPMECLRTNKIAPQVAMLEEVENYTFFQENDILMAKVTPCFENKNIAKAVDLQNRIGFGTSEIYVFRCFDIFEDYFLYFLQGDTFSQKAISEMRGANGLKRIPANFVENFKIPLPPLHEQEAIAHYLDEKTQTIDELISTHQKSIEKLKDYRTSLISEAVTQGLDKNVELKNSGIEWMGEIPKHWGMIKIGLAFKKIGSGTTPQSDNETYYDGDIPWVNSGDLNDSVLIKTTKKVTLKALNDYSALKIYPRHTLVIAMYGATIGKVSLLGIEACVNQACCILNCSSCFEQKFVFYWFLGNRQNIINLGIGGGQQNISQDIIKKIKIPLPPLQEQETIARYLDKKTQAIDELISTHQKSIEKLKDYRTSLISEAVTGKKNLQGINNGN
ncbi:restriction endonuclease subunit S [Helicobacter cholecystus]|uniref:restriction endonuclease subunit S n=1 Tax=Helicobacter cholecystus TaxID=45498 RepID=UPI00273A3438|nr:restriction endonuclease subunit S [Helicobacter cholecystus]